MNLDGKLIIPHNITAVGNPDKDKTTRIYIPSKVHQKVDEFSRIESNVQSGGVFMGNILEADGLYHIVIKDFIIAENTQATKKSLTFTKNTWNYIDKEKKKYPDCQMVGWMHTNPDCGIEISEYDEFLQSHIFRNVHAVLHIVDPVQEIETYYYMKDNAMQKTYGFYLYDEESDEFGDAMEGNDMKKGEGSSQVEFDLREVFETAEKKVMSDRSDLEAEEYIKQGTGKETPDFIVDDSVKVLEKKESFLADDRVDNTKGTNEGVIELIEIDDPEELEEANNEFETVHDEAVKQEMEAMHKEAERQADIERAALKEKKNKPEAGSSLRNNNEVKAEKPYDKAQEYYEQPAKTGAGTKIVVSILTISVVALIAVVVFMGMKLQKMSQHISEMESNINVLYDNDVAIGNYFNTAEEETTTE